MQVQHLSGAGLEEPAIAGMPTVRNLLRAVQAAPRVTQARARHHPEQTLSPVDWVRLRPHGRLLGATHRTLIALNRALMRGVFRLRASGVERLPDEPFVLAPNRASDIDAFVISAALPAAMHDRTCWAGWAGIAHANAATRVFSRIGHVLAVDSARGAFGSLALAAAALERGHGERTPCGHRREARSHGLRIGAELKSVYRRRIRASELLSQTAASHSVESVALGDLVDRLDRRAFGILLFVGTLPALIPSPVGAGALAAPLVILCGMQLAMGMARPWLPEWLRRRRFARVAAQAFLDRAGRWLLRVEHLARPRWMPVLGPVGMRLVGVLTVGYGIALGMPLPLTNYPFAAVALVLAVALLEDDGLLASAAVIDMIVAMAVVIAGGGAVVALFA